MEYLAQKEMQPPILWLHIISGTLALISGLISLLVSKGGEVHKNSGRIFFYSILTLAITSGFLSIIKENSFLFLVAVFTFYLNLSGSLFIKKLNRHKIGFADFTGITTSILLTFYLISLSVYSLITLQTDKPIFEIIKTSSVSALSSWLFFIILKDARLFFSSETFAPEQLLRHHIIRMVSAFISTVTAFFVVNVHITPAFIPWVVPGIAGSILINQYLKKHFPKNKPVNIS